MNSDDNAVTQTRNLEWFIARVLFASRWLLAPIYLGLCLAMLPLLFAFLKELWHLGSNIAVATETEVILGVLTLVDLAMTGALLIIVIFSGYQNFVSRIELTGHKDWPDWMGSIDFSGLKLKILASIVAISAVELLKEFMGLANVSAADERRLFWLVVIQVVFVVSSVVLAFADWLGGAAHGPEAK